MASSFTCDGCGAAVENPAKVGHVLQRDYCEKCKPLAESFMASEEELRAATQAGFAMARGVLIDEVKAKLKLLPDVPT